MRSYDDVTFTEFDRNPNFVPNDILPYFVVRSKNHGNCSPCWMNFIHDEIVNSLMEQ
jgi:hypothetical protein